MAKIKWKAGTMLSPLPPVLVSCGTVEEPKVLTIAWTGIIASDPVLTYVSIRPERNSHDIIKESGEFVINLPNLALLNATDFCGVKSGRDVDKFKEMNLTAGACSEVSAPQIIESPVSIECKVKSITNYGTHDMFLAEVVAVNIDDKYLDKSGKLCLEKAGLLAFSHGTYFTLGRELGTMGFSVNKKRLEQMEKMKKVEVVIKEKKFVKDEEEKKPARRNSKPAGRSDDRRKKSFEKTGGDRRFAEKSDRPREDRKPRSFDDKPKRDFGDRKPREFGDRPKRDFEDKPKRDFNDRKPREFGDRKPREFGDRPKRDFSDKPKRDFGDRKPRDFGDKPKRDFKDRPRKDLGDRPRKSFKR